MSTLLSAQSVSYDLTSGPLLEGISFTLKKGDRIGLIGHNGCGKSTLLKLLSGDLNALSGSVSQSSQCLMERVEQHLPETIEHLSMFDAVAAQLPESLRIAEGWRIERLLADMGFDDSDWQLTAGTLSGGQHTRLLLARALINQPDLLLLDEPSNHLDLPTLLWLENFLRHWQGSFVLVSHDQRLLDNVTNCTWIMRDKTLQFFRLPCSSARKALAEKDETDELRHQSEQKEIDRVEKSARRLALWGQVYDNEDLSRKAKNMEKRVERLKDEQTELTAGTPWRLSLTGEALPADRLLSLTSLDVQPATDAPTLFHILDQQLKSGDRVAIVGRNGCGKSSLLRRLWAVYQTSAEYSPGKTIQFHPRCRLGYYDQSLQQLNDNDSLLDALRHFAPLPDRERKMALISAGFPYLRHTQKVRELSGGERSRLLFIGLTLANHHLLFLDEPTNHLDLEGKEELAETLSQFAGGFILVSHDRDLIEKSCNRYWLVDDHRLEEWLDPEAMYTAMGAEQTVSLQQDDALPTPDVNAVQTAETSHEDALFEQLIDLEARLEADLERKPKHQKPRLQQEWREAIAQITARLGLE
ncbi:ABC-F family ATP-binding cassette domain-containing protein [Endozoicomonas lisbonensis]|uniref:ATP-binding cassette subfamily F protein 3 n=1 Tax=Endozoicomonas lisbonensis TaxID=3120522 RepID=A0ABV2SB27_9GAMM